MNIKILINGFIAIANTSIDFFGISVTFLELILYVAFGSIVAWLIGGLLR